MVKRNSILVVLLLVATAGCSGYRTYREAQIAEQQGDWDQAVVHYLEVVQHDPGNVAYKAALLRAKLKASQQHFERGKRFQEAGVLERALVELRQAVELDPTNQYAQVEMDRLRSQLEARNGGAAEKSIDELKKEAAVKSQPPTLNPRSAEPISLDFPNPVSIFDIYRSLGKAFGINIIFDPNLKDQKIAIQLKEVTAQTALETLMRAAGHFYKVIDEHSIIIAADNPQNRRTYEDQVIQTFFLSNADVKQVMTMLRSLIGAKNIAANEDLNAIVLRDNTDTVKVAQKIIEANDKSRGEVVVDVELLQLNTSKLRTLGVSLSNYQVTQSLDLGNENAKLHLSDLEFLNQNNWVLSIPNFLYDFMKQNTDAQLLAHPQLRISDGEKANLHIGDRVPIPVTTFNTAQTVGGNIVPITSFQYQDVGIRIEIEPRIHHNQEITLKLKVEVSNVNGFVGGSGGQQQPIIGTRTIESTIRLKDGETNLLAGLIRTDDTNQETGVPGISEIPVIGRLFSRNHTDHQRTDVVLTLTPHVIRTPDITEQDLLPIWVGTEANISFRGGSPQVESGVEGPFENEGTPEQVQEMIRRRLQSLPRGLRGTAGREQGEQQAPGQQPPAPQPAPPPGVDLVPPAMPNDVFREPPPPAAPPAAPPPAFSPVANVRSIVLQPVAGLAAGEPAPPVPSTGAELRLLPERLTVAPGRRATVELWAASARPLAHVPVELRFDPAVLEIVAVDNGGFLGDAGEATVLGDASHAGSLVIGASRLGSRPGVTGAGPVARITFRALAPGATAIRFARGEARGPRLGVVAPLTTAAARIEVVPAARPPRQRTRPLPPHGIEVG